MTRRRTAAAVALTLLPGDVTSGSRSASASRSHHAVPESRPEDQHRCHGRAAAGSYVVGLHRYVNHSGEIRAYSRHLGGSQRCRDVDLSSGSNAPISTR